jgi:hypothetical protein
MDDHRVPRDELLRKLKRAAFVRVLVTLSSAVLVLFVAAGVLGDTVDTGWFVAIYFGGCFAVSALVTQFYCKRVVTCHCCGGSLWRCGTGSFKVRRMKIRDGIEECPCCHAKLG